MVYIFLLRFILQGIFWGSRIFCRKFIDWWIRPSERVGIWRRKQFAFRFRFSLITFSLVNRFTLYSHIVAKVETYTLICQIVTFKW